MDFTEGFVPLRQLGDIEGRASVESQCESFQRIFLSLFLLPREAEDVDEGGIRETERRGTCVLL